MSKRFPDIKERKKIGFIKNRCTFWNNGYFHTPSYKLKGIYFILARESKAN